MLECEGWFLKSLALCILKLVMKYGRCQMKIITPLAVAAAFAVAVGLSAPASAQTPSAKTGARAANLSGVVFESWGMLGGLTTTLKIPEQKEFIFDVSLQCGLYTYTKASSKKSVRNFDTVEAGIKVAVKWTNIDTGESGWAMPNSDTSVAGGLDGDGFPDGVTYCSRMQSLAATFQGDLLQCIEPDGTVTINDECQTEESVELTLETLAAHAFNFYAEDIGQGTYEITVWANPECSGDESAPVCDPAGDARAWIGMGTMVVDEVRFGK